MLKKVSLSLASLAVLTACASCTTLPDESVDPASTMLVPVTVDNATEVTLPRTRIVSDLETADGEKMDISGLKMVKFGFDSTAISSEYQRNLRALAEVINVENPEEVVIQGHCDERGTREYNLALGDRRAVAVKKYLVGLGVDASKLSTVSYGKERPVNAGHTEAAWADNRNAQIKFK